MRIIIIIILAVSGISALSAQTYLTLKDVDKKTYAIFIEGRKMAMQQAFGIAKGKYREALERTPNFQDAMMELAGIYFSQKNSDSSIYYLKRVKEINPHPSARVYFTLATLYYQEEKFREAIPEYESYLASDLKNPRSVQDAQIRLANCKFAIDAMAHPKEFDPQPLSDLINTDLPEYLPSISADGSLLIYSRMIDLQEDLYYSEYDGKEWSVGRPLEGVNTEQFNEAGHCISADGKTIVFTGCNRPDGMGSCDLYISYLRKGRWTEPRNMGNPVNTAGWESQPSLSADGNTLFFASDRPGGYGFKDIWYSERSDAGKWSVPRNIMAPVNTTKNDGSPFIHPDNQTLYFMSDGLPGMGGTDLYISRKDEDGQWSMPQNLGYPINTTGNEGALVVNTLGNKAFFTAPKQKGAPRVNGMEDTDIYWFDLDKSLRPQPVSYFKALVVDSISRKPLQCEVQVTEISGEKFYYKGTTADDGTTLICLPKSKLYGIQINAPGYIFISESIMLPDSGDVDHPHIGTYLMKRIEESKHLPMVLKNIYFTSGSDTLSGVSDVELKVLVRMVQSNPGIRIQINGHTDDVGSEMDNMNLSERRAGAVKRRLVQLGLPPELIAVKGYGESRPCAENKTEAGRSKNRRIEFQIE